MLPKKDPVNRSLQPAFKTQTNRETPHNTVVSQHLENNSLKETKQKKNCKIANKTTTTA
jgi:hypothetical protein